MTSQKHNHPLRINSRKLSNHKFRRAEESILRAFFSLPQTISVTCLSLRAKISRATFYRHHRSVGEIIPDYEKYLLSEYQKQLTKMTKKRFSLRNIYWYTLIFIMSYKFIFNFLTQKAHSRAIEEIIVALKPTIVASWQEAGDYVFYVYQKEITGVIEKWGQQGFPNTGIPQVFQDIMFLTESAESRLAPLSKT